MLYPAAGWPPAPRLVPRGPSFPPSLLTRRAPGWTLVHSCPRSCVHPFLPARRGPVPASFPNRALLPPCLRPGTPSHRVLPTSESARHPHFPPSTRRLPVRPNFSRPRPGPRSSGDSMSRAATGGRAGSHSLCPCPPSRHELRLGPARRSGLSGQPGAEAEAEPAWREPRCPSARTPARCHLSEPARSPRRRAAPCPPARRRRRRSPPPAPPPPPLPGIRGSGRRRSRSSPRLASPLGARAGGSATPDRSARRPLPPGSRILSP